MIISLKPFEQRKRYYFHLPGNHVASVKLVVSWSKPGRQIKMKSVTPRPQINLNKDTCLAKVQILCTWIPCNYQDHNTSEAALFIRTQQVTALSLLPNPASHLATRARKHDL